MEKITIATFILCAHAVLNIFVCIGHKVIKIRQNKKNSLIQSEEGLYGLPLVEFFLKFYFVAVEMLALVILLAFFYHEQFLHCIALIGISILASLFIKFRI